MPAMIFEDRVLARVAFQAVGRSKPADVNEAAECAIGHAIGALRKLGAVITPWTVRALQDDVAIIFADPAKMTQARASATHPISDMPADAAVPMSSREAIPTC